MLTLCGASGRSGWFGRFFLRVQQKFGPELGSPASAATDCEVEGGDPVLGRDARYHDCGGSYGMWKDHANTPGPCSHSIPIFNTTKSR
eukprot:1182180-Prorocentrum_minimum.AAC.2